MSTEGPTSASDGARIEIGPGSAGAGAFGDLVRAARTEQGLRVAEVADRVRLTPAYLRMIERGDRSPSQRAAGALVRALGFEVRPTRDGSDDPGEDGEFEVHRNGITWRLAFPSRTATDPQGALRLIHLWLQETEARSEHASTALLRRWVASKPDEELQQRDILLAEIVRKIALLEAPELMRVLDAVADATGESPL